jgi:hypothetical protein
LGTIVGTTIINKAAIQLTDLTNIRWTRSELLGWLNDAQRQIVLMQPNSSNKTAAQKLIVGSRQRIPSDGWLLLDIYRNMGTDGLTPGNVVRVVSRQLLDAYAPTWHSSAPSAVTQNFIFDLQDQTAFYVYPPSDGTNWLEVNYAQVPADLATENLTISLSDVVQTAMLDYMMYRACSKDAEYAPGLQLASGYWAAFSAAVGSKAQAELTNDPNLGLGPRDPAKPGGES